MKIKDFVFHVALLAGFSSFATTVDSARQLQSDGNRAEAYVAYTNFIFSADATSANDLAGDRAQSVLDAARCLAEVNRVGEAEPFLEKTWAERTEFPVRLACVQALRELPHGGSMEQGAFARGKWGAEECGSEERDRVIGIRRLVELMPQAKEQTALRQRWYWNEMTLALMQGGRKHGAAWKLQVLTDLSIVPDFEKEDPLFLSRFGNKGGAPVDADGNPVFYGIPERWDAAKSDGERWRFANAERAKVDAKGRKNSLRELARFASIQFSTRNLECDENAKRLIDELKTLDDDETMTRLANGIRRFKLPEGYRFLRMDEELGSHELGMEYESRHQFEKAAAAYAKTGHGGYRDRILDPRVSIDGRVPAVGEAHRGQFTLISRNATRATCSLRLIDDARWRKDKENEYRDDAVGKSWSYRTCNFANALSYSGAAATNFIARYVSREAKTWTVELESAADHSDRRRTVEVPFDLPAGRYLLEVAADGERGNRIHSVLNVESLAVVQEHCTQDGGGTVRVVDAETGAPVADARARVVHWYAKGSNRRKSGIAELEFRTDKTGAFAIPPRFGLKEGDRSEASYVEIESKDGRKGFSELASRWFGESGQPQGLHAVIVTDRPAYRPGDTVRYKAWVVDKSYATKGRSPRAGLSVGICAKAPKDGERIMEQKGRLDEFGGCSGSFALPADATLGAYRMRVEVKNLDMGDDTVFRVEEYRKPEFAVSVEAPKGPLTLGDSVTATVKATYHYGEPVKGGTAEVTVRRTPKRASWYPKWEWDWLYGAGAWWRFYDADWYEGPGCLRICRPFCTRGRWWRPTPAPETVVSLTVPLDGKGEAKVTWDTALVRKMHGDDDQEYALSVSVTDASRRTIDGAGRVLVRGEPFRVIAWTDRPRYLVGDKVTANVHLDGLDEENVAKKVWTLFDLDGKKIRDVAESFSATSAGQYRLSCAVTDKGGRTREGSRLIQILGNGNDGRDFRYAALELIPDRRTYAPGDVVKLAINTEHPDSYVFVSARGDETQVVKLDGKTATLEIPVTEDDQPNFFVEAWTVSADRCHREACEIFVPPVSKVGKATVETDRKVFKPGETATVTVKVVDENGRPCDVSGALTVYDKAVDAIAGGPNVPPLAKTLWSWKRWRPNGFHSTCGTAFRILRLPGDSDLTPLGQFGAFGVGTSSDGAGFKAFGGMRREGAREVAKMRARAPAAACTEADAEAPVACEAEPLDAAAESDSGVRKSFADTAYWNAALENAGTRGVYRVSFKMPEDVTGWNVKAWTIGEGGRVAEVATEVVTKKDLMLRLQAPRFFTEKDEVALSANLHNYGPSARSVRATLDLSGVDVSFDLKPQTFALASGGEARADWRVKINASGKLKIRMRVTDGKEADGVERVIDVAPHAVEKTESVFRTWKRGEAAPGIYEGERGLQLYRKMAALPKEVRGECLAVVEVSDTLADAVDRALPYLKHYEYECTEQTMNRFVPAAVARKMLKERSLEANLKDLDDLVAKGLRKLGERQNSDGGWGWFHGPHERSHEHMTALVVRGLGAAKSAGVKVPKETIARGIRWLADAQADSLKRQKENDEIKPSAADALTCWALLAAGSDPNGKALREMLGRAYAARLKLPFCAQALLGLCFDRTGDFPKRDMTVRNLKQFLRTDAENGTAHFDLRNGGCWWRWWGSDLEAQAVALMLLVRAEPESDVTRGLALYLHNSRKSRTHWTNTRDTGLAVEALTAYCEEVEMNARENLHVSGFVTYQTLEEPIAASGLEVKVNRAISRVAETTEEADGRGASGQVVVQKRTKVKLEPLADGDAVKSGEILEIRLDVETKNDCEYILVEDRKGAGFEPLDFRSGYRDLGGAWAYVEFREKKTAMFLREMPRGVRSLTYRVRVETPGAIHVLPARVEAMYAPRLRGNSGEIRLKVEDKSAGRGRVPASQYGNAHI